MFKTSLFNVNFISKTFSSASFTFCSLDLASLPVLIFLSCNRPWLHITWQKCIRWSQPALHALWLVCQQPITGLHSAPASVSFSPVLRPFFLASTSPLCPPRRHAIFRRPSDAPYLVPYTLCTAKVPDPHHLTPRSRRPSSSFTPLLLFLLLVGWRVCSRFGGGRSHL